MDRATHDTDIDALVDEIDALLADSAARDARMAALLQRTSSTAAMVADLEHQSRRATHDLAVQERYQRRIARTIDALG